MKKVYLLAIAFAMVAPSIIISSTVTAAAGKPTMAVNEFKNETRAHWWRSGVGKDLAVLLTNELASSGKFKMVERKKIGAVLDEQDLGASGRVRKKTAAKLGKLTGAQYIVVATVTAYEENTSKRGGGVSFGGISIGGKKEKSYISVDLEVVNTTTGDIDYTRSVEAKASGGGLSLGIFKGGFGGTLGGSEKTPQGKAIRAVVIEISEYLECAMVDQDSCLSEYKEKERKRREKTKSSISLDE